MNIQRKKFEELLHELGRYKKKVSDDAKVIRELRETIEGWEELERMKTVILAAALAVCGVNKDHPIEIRMDDIKEKFHTLDVCVEVDVESRKYKLHPMMNTTTEDATEQLNAETEQETGN